jgi:transposase
MAGAHQLARLYTSVLGGVSCPAEVTNRAWLLVGELPRVPWRLRLVSGGWSHGRIREVSTELRERAVRMAFEHQEEHPSQWAAICSIAQKFGISHETLRKWVRRAEVDGGLRPGLTTDERERLKSLERENKELRRANEILRSTAAFFGAELDRRPTR